jgi:formylglycine-generating enzyme required for sulfatase activity
MPHQVRLLALVVPLLALVPLLARQAEKPDAKRILARFVEELIEVKPGTSGRPARFQMGSSAKGVPASETPAVTVTLKKNFRMAKYEVTQELYTVVVGSNPSRWKGPRNAVEMVDHDEATRFCRKLTEQLRERKLIRADEEVRLPSEAEWEYVCRAGTTTRFSFGDRDDQLGEYAWYKANSKGEDPPVGRKKGNSWGFYDMHGYVSEWCADTWSPTHEGAPTDGSPRNKPDEKGRVIRGGSFADPPEQCTSSARMRAPANTRSDKIGFRCVVAAVEEKSTPAGKEGK